MLLIFFRPPSWETGHILKMKADTRGWKKCLKNQHKTRKNTPNKFTLGWKKIFGTMGAYIFCSRFLLRRPRGGDIIHRAGVFFFGAAPRDTYIHGRISSFSFGRQAGTHVYIQGYQPPHCYCYCYFLCFIVMFHCALLLFLFIIKCMNFNKFMYVYICR